MKFAINIGRTQGNVARCEQEHAGAILALATAEAALDNATQAYAASLGNGKDAALAARRAQGEAEVDRDVARHAVEQAAVRLQSAQAAAATAEAERLRAEAVARIGELEAAATRELKAMAVASRRIARLRAEAELAREAAIQAGVSDVDLPEVEGFRNVPALPEKVIEITRVTRWIHPYTLDPLNDEQMRSVVVHGNNTYLGKGENALRLSDQREFDRVVFLPMQRGKRADSFLETLKVPGLMADDAPGWTELQGTMPQQVLTQLDELESALTPARTDRRQKEIMLRPA